MTTTPGQCETKAAREDAMEIFQYLVCYDGRGQGIDDIPLEKLLAPTLEDWLKLIDMYKTDTWGGRPTGSEEPASVFWISPVEREGWHTHIKEAIQRAGRMAFKTSFKENIVAHVRIALQNLQEHKDKPVHGSSAATFFAHFLYLTREFGDD